MGAKVNPAHVPLEVLLDRFEGRLAADPLAVAEAHLRRCKTCRTLARSVERLCEAMCSDRAELPPAWARNRARALFQPQLLTVPLPRRLNLRLVFDSWLAPAPARRQASDARRVLLSAPGLDVDLEVELDPDARLVQGQALPANPGEWKTLSVQLRRAGRPIQEANVGARMSFAFAPVPPGKYRLALKGNGRSYVFTELEL